MPPTVTSKGAIFRRFRQCRRTEICTVVRTTEGRRIDGTRNNRTPADFERDTGNNGLPIGREPFASPGTSPAALPYREPDAITAYRNNYTTPDYPLQDGKGTIAITELDGKPIFGMNSSAFSIAAIPLGLLAATYAFGSDILSPMAYPLNSS